jgi:hypothetical protein
MIWWEVNGDVEQTKINIYALSGIRTYGLRIQAIKAYASDSAATGIGRIYMLFVQFLTCFIEL